MSDGITALAAGIVGSALTYVWQKAADRRKDRGVRRQLRSMLRILLQRCVYQTVGGPAPPFNLSEYAAMVDALADRAAREDVSMAFNDRQADALYKAVKESVTFKERGRQHYRELGSGEESWVRLPDGFRGQQETGIVCLSFALIALDDDNYVDGAVPVAIKDGELWRIYVHDAFVVYRLPSALHRLANWASRRNRWKGQSIQVDAEGRFSQAPLTPAAQKLKDWFSR